jgi:16S rRNA processing protein RimM
VRGDVKIRSYTEEPEAIFSYRLTDKTGRKSFSLTRRGGNAQAYVAGIEGITDRNEAELLRNTELYAAADELPQKASNEYYYTELKGLEARIPSGKVYGRVINVYNFGAGDIIEIERKNGELEMLPFKAPFVGDVYTAGGYLIITPPEYVEGEKE